MALRLQSQTYNYANALLEPHVFQGIYYDTVTGGEVVRIVNLVDMPANATQLADAIEAAFPLDTYEWGVAAPPRK